MFLFGLSCAFPQPDSHYPELCLLFSTLKTFTNIFVPKQYIVFFCLLRRYLTLSSVTCFFHSVLSNTLYCVLLQFIHFYGHKLFIGVLLCSLFIYSPEEWVFGFSHFCWLLHTICCERSCSGFLMHVQWEFLNLCKSIGCKWYISGALFWAVI